MAILGTPDRDIGSPSSWGICDALWVEVELAEPVVGVQMLVWPLHAEQHLNAYEMGRVLGVALEPELDNENGGFSELRETGEWSENVDGRR